MKDIKFKGREIDTILDILWAIKNDDKHYFYSYGRDCLQKLVKESDSLPCVSKRQTEIKDRNGNMIYFGDKVRFADKIEWYKSEYWAKVAVGSMTREDALKEIESKPYEERLVESVQDYDWLLSSEIQTYWEVVC